MNARQQADKPGALLSHSGASPQFFSVKAARCACYNGSAALLFLRSAWRCFLPDLRTRGKPAALSSTGRWHAWGQPEAKFFGNAHIARPRRAPVSPAAGSFFQPPVCFSPNSVCGGPSALSGNVRYGQGRGGKRLMFQTGTCKASMQAHKDLGISRRKPPPCRPATASLPAFGLHPMAQENRDWALRFNARL